MKNIAFFSIFIFFSANAFSQYIHHNLNVDLNPTDNYIKVTDSIQITEDLVSDNNSLFMTLNKNLEIKSLSNFISLELIENPEENWFAEYKIIFKNKNNPIVLPFYYEGIVKDEIETGAAEYARGFSETRGMISDNGIYLSGSSYWIPKIKSDHLMTFNLDVVIDSSWSVVSQGTRTSKITEADKKYIRYECPDPMDEIYLISAKWTEYSIMANEVLVQAFLRSPDEKLANRYLNVTSSYIKLYEDLIGEYPYTKFALVENFWETGYGMPSFTLLGEKVIRFPWILHSSYPHELLHNYWGNSVYVDYEQGNWCEGITAYMADHLIKEQQGQGAEYRRTTLQKFTDYVNEENDFPVSEFISRNNSAQEAIGYGKCLMFNDMLRYEVGDELYIEGYRKFYQDYRFKKASFDDIRTSFESVTKKELGSFFDQWLTRKGAPKIEVSNVQSSKDGDSYQLKFSLSQTQSEDVFSVQVPAYIYLENEENVIEKALVLDQREKEFVLEFTKQPLRIEIDPQFNIFRRLDNSEVPATLSQILGSSSVLMVLPKGSALETNYLQLAETWKGIQAAQHKTLEIVYDEDLEMLPNDTPVWIVGFENKFFDKVQIKEGLKAFLNADEQMKMEEIKSEGSLVYAISNPEKMEQTLGFIGTTNDKAVSGLTRKLTHYGKYSYLGFKGEAPDNVLKGVFPALKSPLNVSINKGELKGKIIPRKALSN